MAGFHGDSWIPVQRECFSFPSGEGPCLSPSPSRGRACPRGGGGRDGDWFCRGLEGNPSPPKPSPGRRGLQRCYIGPDSTSPSAFFFAPLRYSSQPTTTSTPRPTSWPNRNCSGSASTSALPDTTIGLAKIGRASGRESV